jgi:hypothetical protein
VRKSAQIIKVEPPQLTSQPRFAVAPKILETARDMEQVRRFVMRCLNVDYQKQAPRIGQEMAAIHDKALAENRELSKAEKDRIEELRDKLTALEVDWGTIPGSKPFLKQPGAEKFMLWLNIKPRYHKTVLELGDGHLEIVCYCTFHVKQSGEEIFEGPEASCSTMETNYRYIWAESGFLPNDEQVNKGYQTKMGQWRWVDDWQKGKKVGRKKVWYIRIDNPNIHNERNKVRQIGQKRGLVKGTRNLGAMSELFAAGPDEWDVPPDEDEEQPDSPGVEKDYTPGGRKVYHDGVSPSGREQSRTEEYRKSQDKPREPDADVMAKSKARGTWCEKHQCDFGKCPADDHSAGELEAMDVAEARAKEAQTTPPTTQVPKASQGQPVQEQPSNTKWAGEIEIDYTGNPGPYKSEVCPIVRGDLAEILGPLKACGVFWYSADSWNHIKQTDVPRLLAYAKEHNYLVRITKASSPSTTPGKIPESERASAAGKGGGSRKPTEHRIAAPMPPEPIRLLGTVERVNHVITPKGKHMAYITLKGKKRKYDLSSWDKDINEILEKAKGKQADVYIIQKGKYRNLVGLKNVAGQEFIDGKTPVVPVDREPGKTTLFT